MTYGETPPEPGFHLDEETKNLVMHTQLNIRGNTVMFSDAF
jgi:PhnB protein